MNNYLLLGFMLYGFVVSYIVASTTGKVLNRRGVRLHHFELGLSLMVINAIFIVIFATIGFNTALELFAYMFMLSLGILLSDLKDFAKWLI